MQTAIQAESCLRWAVRESLLRYVTVIAGGTCTVDGDAVAGEDGVFTFPLRSAVQEGDDWRLSFSGSVRFEAHHGLMDVLIKDPEVVVGPGARRPRDAHDAATSCWRWSRSTRRRPPTMARLSYGLRCRRSSPRRPSSCSAPSIRPAPAWHRSRSGCATRFLTMSQSVSERAARTPGRKPSGERGNVRGEATRQLILIAAERLFAEHGISAVPLRDIGIEAGQKNHAAVQYHFGDRDALVQALMEFRGAESESVRTDIVTGLMVGGNVPVVADVVGAFVRPLAVHLAPDNHYLAFLSLLITEQGGYEGLGGDVHTGASVVSLRAAARRVSCPMCRRRCSTSDGR